MSQLYRKNDSKNSHHAPLSVLMLPMFLLQLQKHYKKQVRDLRQSVEVLRAKEEQLSADKEALK